MTNIEKNPENAVKITNASEDITFERTKENNIPAIADNSNDAEYAQNNMHKIRGAFKAPLIIYAKEPGLQAVNHTRRATAPSKAANAEMRC